jgi:hypothetical protein
MQQFRQPRNMTIGIELASKNDGLDMFDQAGVAAE